MQPDDVEYAGFWIRVGAALIDSLLILMVIVPLLVAIYGWSYIVKPTSLIDSPTGFLIRWVAPAVAVIAFWLYRQATPGKMVLSLRVVDATTGGPLSVGQSIGRYLGYYVSTIPLFMGLIWVALDRRKQGWHDKLAGTVVIRSKARGTEPVGSELKR